jgi:hypothetical protein
MNGRRRAHAKKGRAADDRRARPRIERYGWTFDSPMDHPQLFEEVLLHIEGASHMLGNFVRTASWTVQ